ncbi:ATP-binding protein [Virgibacillus sp. C22-A2]|uniref:histidine kinase n=1 Tax=Virgibacillus tibetensis TaxID=3042313 RepID=A0ABU6KB86_9BACI|nr:ATP-binding protein [Virgibacillus sp. C22-A2]
MGFEEDLSNGTDNGEQTPKIPDNKNIQKDFPDLSSLPPFILRWVEQNSNDIITVWGHDGRILFISQSIEQLLGYKTIDLRGTHWYDKISPEDVSYIKNKFENQLNKTQLFKVNILDSRGKYIWSECTVAKVKDENCKTYFISTLKDITDKKQAEEMMIRSEKMSVAGQLAAGIAHEIRNPLTSLKGFLQLLQAGVNRKEEYYNIMIEEIEKMESITSELLFISKPLTDNKKVESVKKMIDDVVILLEPQAKLKTIKIECFVSEKEFIYCDRSQIKQVLINLVKNAIEAMDEPGTVKIAADSNKAHSEINIVDEGPGIPEEIIHKLGEPFFTTKQTGTGLGLMITKQILERHGAELKINKNDTVGSTFQIIFSTTI